MFKKYKGEFRVAEVYISPFRVERQKGAEMVVVTEEIKAKAEIYNGDEICQVKSKILLTDVGLPDGLLPLQEIEECGYVKETGFVWLKQKKKLTHKFEKIGKLASYEPEITAYVEPNKIKKLTGVKTKELLLWITLSEIYVDDPPTGKITFKTPTGLYRSFPVSAFQLDQDAARAAAPSPAQDDVKKKPTDATTEPNPNLVKEV